MRDEEMTRSRKGRLPQISPTRTPLSTDPAGVLRRQGFSVGQWRVEPRRNRIVCNGEARTLDPRLIDVLIALARRPGQVVSRDELFDEVWDGVLVNENSLSQAISRLRKALGDQRRRPRFIETISRQGYRLIASVSGEAACSSAPTSGAGPRRPPAVAERWWVSWVLVGIAAVLATGLLARSLLRGPTPAQAVATTVPDVRPELTLAGTQFDPRLSPDGTRVVFSWRGPEPSSSGWDLWVQEVGGDNPVRLTDHEHDERLPAWSGDGRSIAFVRFAPNTDACDILALPALGGPAERLTGCAPGLRTLAWSPDGRHLVFNGFTTPAGETRALFTEEIATGRRTRLTAPSPDTPGDGRVALSPDGSLVAFVREQGPFRHDALIVPISGGPARALSGDAWGRIRGLDFSSDGTKVLFSSNRGGSFALWQVSLAGGTPARVPILDTWVTQPSVSRAGGRLIYRTFRDSVDIWELPLDDAGLAAGEPIRRVPSSRSERSPAWSPRGDAIAFVSDRSGSTELWSARPDGTGLRRHTDLRGPLPGSPAWSPDGRRLVYDAAVHGHADLWVVDRDSRRSRRLTDSPSEDRNGVFSRDGRSLYFASQRGGEWEIWRMPAGGGPAVQVTEGGGFLAQESPDGRHLFYVKLDRPGLWRLSVAGGSPREVLAGVDLIDWGSWTVGDAGTYIVMRNPTAIGFLPHEESEPRIVHSPGGQIPYLGRALSLSADGRSLLFAMIDHSDDEVMRVDLAGL